MNISAEVRREIEEAWDKCVRRYPAIRLDREHFAERLLEIAESAGETDGPQLSRLHHEDLYLALACSAGNSVAWECFLEEYLPLIRRMAAQSCRHLQESEDLSQDLVSALLEPGASKLSGYNGRGSLGGWLRVTIAHAAIDRFRRARKQVSLEELEEGGLQLRKGAEAPEERVDDRWGPVLARVLAEELERLPARDRIMLDLYYVREVPLKSLGAHFGVHEATASRWMEALRRKIRKRVELELRRRHGLRASELRSLWNRVSENEEFRLESLLAGPGE